MNKELAISILCGDVLGTNEQTHEAVFMAIKALKAEPVRHGKWIEHHKPYTWMGYTYWSCSECGFECGYEKDITSRTKYCPHCGAKLDSNDSNALNALNALEIDEVVEK